MTQPKLTLISHHLCPFVQRAAIALLEKGVDFSLVDAAFAPAFRYFDVIGRLAQNQAPEIESAA